MDLDVVIAQLKWMESRQDERHRDQTARLDRIETQVRETNGRVSRHDSEIARLIEQVRTLFRRRQAHATDEEHGPVSEWRLWRYGGLAVASAIAGFWLAQVLR